MVFAGIGAWLVFKNVLNPTNQKRDLHVFALLFGLLGVYISSAFIRLELFSSLSLVILGSVGLSLLTKEIFKPARQETKKPVKSHPTTIKISFLVVITIFLIMPMMVPVSANWVNGAKAPPTILNGGSNYNIATTDWLDAMQWIRENTPEDAVVAAWWDYGYWITTPGERRSIADNATLIDWRIEQIAKAFLSTPDEGWKILQEMDADYVLIYVAAQRVNSEEPPYDLGSLLLETGRHADAATRFRASLATNPRSPRRSTTSVSRSRRRGSCGRPPGSSNRPWRSTPHSPMPRGT